MTSPQRPWSITTASSTSSSATRWWRPSRRCWPATSTPIRAVEAAQALLRATGHEDAEGPWAPLGAGVHTGIAWMGAVGEGPHAAMTALGDTVNIAARLASLAAAGEILVTTDAARAAGLDANLPRRQLELKGKQQTTEVVALTIGVPAASRTA